MSSIGKRLALGVAVAALATIQVLLVGCGEPAEGDPTPVKTFKITPAATGAAQTTVPEVTATRAPAGTPSPDGAVLEVAGISTTFDVTELEAPAGPVTIKFDNRDAGVVHNLSVYPGDDASQDPLGSTDLESGPIEQQFTLTLEPGSYFYQCDAHPATMHGTLSVTS